MVLLQKRKGGWGDGLWEAGASGHIDHGESPVDAIIHEAKEELCIKISKKDVVFFSVINKHASKKDIFYNFSFYCEKWTGVPKIGEEDKISDIKWFDIKKLPKNIICDRKIALGNFLNKKYYDEYYIKNN
jgi:ADP-ribose pyrophosphatase YjhB (NUDIX family)